MRLLMMMRSERSLATTTFKEGNVVRVTYKDGIRVVKPGSPWNYWYGKIGRVVKTKPGYNPVPGKVWVDIPNEGTPVTCWSVYHLEFVAESEEDLMDRVLGPDYL